ncbi:MAG: DUF262 domain-containing protein [Luteolibacter sp.]
MSKIHGKEQRIGEVFSSAYAFTIPPYQRPYRWELQQASELFDDILSASREAGKNSDDPYFLGSIVLIKEESKPEADVIDGQQRLTTLSLLLAVILKSLPSTDVEAMKALLYERGNEIMGTKDRYRLQLRDRENPFYEQHVLKSPDFSSLEALDPAQLSDPKKRLRENLLLFQQRIESLSSIERQTFAKYLIQSTFLIVVFTPSLDSAFRIFSVLNDRGLDLSASDILKAEIIGVIGTMERAAYTKKWEDAEELLGNQTFSELFSNIRFIHTCKKQKASVLNEVREFVKPKDRPKEFIDTELTPYSIALEQIRNRTYESTTAAEEVNRLLGYLARLEERDWTAPALLYHSRHAHDSSKLKIFYADLERLSSIMWILGYDVNKRIERYGRLLGAIIRDENLCATDSPLQLSDTERTEALELLDGEIYTISPKKRTMILLRLDGELSSGEASYSFTTITVEHIAPQNPKEGSQWLTWWTNEERRLAALHRLGNLTLLNGRQNPAAGNYEFDIKKSAYFSKRHGSCPFSLTAQVLKEPEWTPSVFEHRQRLLLQTLKKAWRL